MGVLRRRRRPRVRSFSFQSLKWVLVREAAFRVFYPEGSTHGNVRAYKHPFVTTPTDKVVTQAGILLALHPERRYWPPGDR